MFLLVLNSYYHILLTEQTIAGGVNVESDREKEDCKRIIQDGESHMKEESSSKRDVKPKKKKV